MRTYQVEQVNGTKDGFHVRVLEYGKVVCEYKFKSPKTVGEVINMFFQENERNGVIFGRYYAIERNTFHVCTI